MIDSHNRTIEYLRVSLTDRCNLRCLYCMPQSGDFLPEAELLTNAEVLRVCREAATVGIKYVKLTGGEPLLRPGVPALVKALKKIPGIEGVSLTTNGVLLSRYLDDLCAAGIDGITISLDSLDPERFAAITGCSGLPGVLGAVHEAAARQIRVKVNVVLLDSGGEPAWRDLADLARTEPIQVRFIELMPIGYGNEWVGVKNDVILELLKQAYPAAQEDSGTKGPGPAVYYRIPGFAGGIGFISAVSHSFCRGCNRIRLTPEGILKPCLCYAGGIDLKAVLREEKTAPDGIRQALLAAAALKPAAHNFTSPAAPLPREQKPMSSIGG